MSQPQIQTPADSAPPGTKATSYLDLGITLALHSWPALNLAVQSSWGGPTSSDKRDWLCGAISEMIADRPETDAEDLEDVLVQVMNDEFDVVVDDESAAPVAAQIMDMRGNVARGEFEGIRALWAEWEAKSRKKAESVVGSFRRVEDKAGETDDEEDDEEQDGDMEMGEAPELVRAPKEKVEPEVDDDGFTKVVGKKKR